MEGVREVTADHSTGQVRVRVGPDFADPAVLAQRLETAGYRVVDGG